MTLLGARTGRVALGTVWAALVAYSLLAAPPRDLALERAMWTFRFGEVDASVVALFLTMGLTADLFVVLLLRDGRFRRVPGWPVAIATFVLGSFVLLPYLALRGAPGPPRPVGTVTRIASSRPIGWPRSAAPNRSDLSRRRRGAAESSAHGACAEAAAG